MNCVHINICQKKGCCFKIRMEFLRPILVKIELICQQPAITRPTGVIGVLSPAVGCWIGWLGGWRCVLDMSIIKISWPIIYAQNMKFSWASDPNPTEGWSHLLRTWRCASSIRISSLNTQSPYQSRSRGGANLNFSIYNKWVLHEPLCNVIMLSFACHQQ